MAIGKYSLQLPNGQTLNYDSPEELRGIFQRHYMADRLSKVLPSEVRSHMRNQATGLQKYLTEELPKQREFLETTVSEGKRDSFLGKIGAYLEGGVAWVDTAAEAGKLSPSPWTQAVSRTWLGSTQATKAALNYLDGKGSEATENFSGAVSQIPGLGEADKAKKVLSVFNKSQQATTEIMNGDPARGAGTAVEAAGEFVKDGVVGSAVQAGAITGKSVLNIQEMNRVDDTLDRSLPGFDKTAAELTDRFTRKSNDLQIFASLADEAERGDSSAILDAIRRQHPALASEAEQALQPSLRDATKTAQDLAVQSLRKQAPASVDGYLENQRQLEESLVSPEGSISSGGGPIQSEKSLYWFDPNDKDGFINVRAPDGSYRRMALDDAIAQELVPKGTTIGDMTQYRAKDDQFLNDIDTSNRGESREDRIGSTDYSGDTARPTGEGSKDGSASFLPETELQSRNQPLEEPQTGSSMLSETADPSAQMGSTQGSVTPGTPAADSDVSNYLNPSGGGSITDGPTYGYWGGGGYSGGDRDDLQACKIDWKAPQNKLDEAFHIHDYAYMRDGLNADTPQSNPLKQAADLQLLENLRAIPDSELSPQALLFKTNAELFFGKQTSGRYDPELIEKLDNMPNSGLDWEEKVVKFGAEYWARGNNAKDDVVDLAGDVYDAAGNKIGEAVDALKKTASDGADALVDGANDAAAWAKRKSEEIGNGLSAGYDKLSGNLSSLLGGAPAPWGGDGGSFGGGGASSSWDAPAAGAVGGAGGGDKSISAIANEAEDKLSDADSGADRAESAARRAESAMRRALRARARILAKLRRSGCWVARKVFGEEDPRWRVFRSWLLAEAPRWLRSRYLLHGEWLAEALPSGSLATRFLRWWMGRVVLRHLSRLADPNLNVARRRRCLRWLNRI